MSAAWLATIETGAADAASELAAALLLSVAAVAAPVLLLLLLEARLVVLELSTCASVAATKVASTSPSTQCLIKVSK